MYSLNFEYTTMIYGDTPSVKTDQDYSSELSAFYEEQPVSERKTLTLELQTECMVLGMCFSSESLAVIDKHKLATSGRSAKEFKMLVASFAAWTEDEKSTIAEHSAAILVADPTFCVDADGPATRDQRLLFDIKAAGPANKAQRMLVARYFPGAGVQKGAIMAPTRRKAMVFANLTETNKRQFETIDGFNTAYDIASENHREVKVRCNDTRTEIGSNLYTAYKEFCKGTAPKVTTQKRKNGDNPYYTPVEDANRKRAKKNATPQEKQEWEATAKKECIQCEKPHLKSEWDAIRLSAWNDKQRCICATCLPKKPNRSVTWARCDSCDLWRILKHAPTSETWHCVDANRQCGGADDKE